MINTRHVLNEIRLIAIEAEKKGVSVRANICPEVFDLLRNKRLSIGKGHTVELISEGWQLWGSRSVYEQNGKIYSGFFIEII